MSHSIDVESFIYEVKKYPEIWDLNSEDNRHKSRKMQAWKEIARVLFKNLDEMSNTEKTEIYRTLCGKWRNIRDSYVRHVKRRYGKRGYKHAKHLSFLNNIYTQNSQSGSEAELDDGWHSDPDESKLKIDKKPFEVKTDLIWTSDAEEEQSLVDDTKRKRPKKEFEYVEPFTETACNFNAEDEDRSFFESLLPAVRTLDIDHKLEFRSQVIQLLKDMRANAKRIKLETNDDGFED
ncbi:hypothetical protein K1T71_011482 [Dendrolimus kikuchii]|uniref:Uncharacterized protein n=1 Tax=Dendrolimus kikuchii TaxID=765133 RepID=A0ACC1CP49_9NEOP|nr:hypothetical protein K1T71_011482 [Dendrolimus kikuchii]